MGETYTEYVMNNVVTTDTVSRIVLNFYPEEVTSLPYMSYDEAACAFAFHPGKTSRYWISWDYETDGSYVEVQYGQNGVWYTINEQRRSGEFLLTANDNMTVRICIRSGEGLRTVTVRQSMPLPLLSTALIFGRKKTELIMIK